MHDASVPGMKQLRSSLLAMPICMGKQCPQISSSSFFGLVTFSSLLQYTQAENCGFSQRVDPPTIDPYQQYINYLKDVVIYNLKRELSEALASPDPSSSAREDRCCKCSTCTCECHKKDWSPLPSPPPPHLVTTCRRKTSAALCSPGSSRTTRFITNVVMKFLNSPKACYQYVRCFVRVLAPYMPLQMCVFSLLNFFKKTSCRGGDAATAVCNRRGPLLLFRIQFGVGTGARHGSWRMVVKTIKFGNHRMFLQND
jgi:hypothetical protein